MNNVEEMLEGGSDKVRARETVELLAADLMASARDLNTKLKAVKAARKALWDVTRREPRVSSAKKLYAYGEGDGDAEIEEESPFPPSETIHTKVTASGSHAELLHALLGVVSESLELSDATAAAFGSQGLAAADRLKIVKELGDLEFYLAAFRTALGTDIVEIADELRKKLDARYPEGSFSAAHALARADEASEPPAVADVQAAVLHDEAPEPVTDDLIVQAVEVADVVFGSPAPQGEISSPDSAFESSSSVVADASPILGDPIAGGAFDGLGGGSDRREWPGLGGLAYGEPTKVYDGEVEGDATAV